MAGIRLAKKRNALAKKPAACRLNFIPCWALEYRLSILRLRRFVYHRSEPDWHFQEKPIHLADTVYQTL
jgi:hypothetical protein